MYLTDCCTGVCSVIKNKTIVDLVHEVHAHEALTKFMLPILFLVYEEYKTFAVHKAYLKFKPLVLHY